MGAVLAQVDGCDLCTIERAGFDDWLIRPLCRLAPASEFAAIFCNFLVRGHVSARLRVVFACRFSLIAPCFSSSPTLRGSATPRHPTRETIDAGRVMRRMELYEKKPQIKSSNKVFESPVVPAKRKASLSQPQLALRLILSFSMDFSETISRILVRSLRTARIPKMNSFLSFVILSVRTLVRSAGSHNLSHLI